MQYKACQGDIIWLDFNPQTGHEQKGRRPAIVISNNDFNNFEKTTAMVCPITNTSRELPTQITLDGDTNTKGVIMCNQAKILDLKQRNAEFIERAPDYITLEATDIVIGFLKSGR